MFRTAATLIAGLTKHSTLPVTHIPLGVLAGAIAAARKLGRDFGKARALTRRSRRDRNKVTAEAQDHAVACRQVLVPALGQIWSTEWIPVGWDQNTLSIPQSAESLVELYQSLTDHLTEHPELASAKYTVTADECQDRLEALEAAITNVNDAKGEQRKAREKRDGADTTLVDRSKALVKELELILKPNDPRWMDFVKEVPADEERPDAVEDLQVDPGAPGELDADWEPSARAERYLVYVKVSGQDAEFRHLLTVRDEGATLTGLPPGRQVTVRVVAANNAGGSAPSDEMVAQVLALAKAA